MPCYVRLEDAALALTTTVSALEDLARWGWISIVEKDGLRYLHGHQQSRAQFVFDLRRQYRLEPGQVTVLLGQVTPPYSNKKIVDMVDSLRTREQERPGNQG